MKRKDAGFPWAGDMRPSLCLQPFANSERNRQGSDNPWLLPIRNSKKFKYKPTVTRLSAFESEMNLIYA